MNILLQAYPVFIPYNSDTNLSQSELIKLTISVLILFNILFFIYHCIRYIYEYVTGYEQNIINYIKDIFEIDSFFVLILNGITIFMDIIFIIFLLAIQISKLL